MFHFYNLTLTCFEVISVKLCLKKKEHVTFKFELGSISKHYLRLLRNAHAEF